MIGERPLLESLWRFRRTMSAFQIPEWGRQNVLEYAESALGILCVVAGAALFPFPMIGLLGIPVVLVGVPLTIYGLFALSDTGRSRLIGRVSGAMLIVLGVGVMFVVSAYHAQEVHACFLAWQRSLPTDLPNFSTVTTLPLIGPALIVGGIWLRRGERPRELAALWAGFVLISFVTILCAIVLALFVPLCA